MIPERSGLLFGDAGFQTHKGDDVIAKVLPRLGQKRSPVEDVKYRGETRPSRVLVRAVGSEMGWSVFALSIGRGYHVACVLLDPRDRRRDFYWFDQIARGRRRRGRGYLESMRRHEMQTSTTAVE